MRHVGVAFVCGELCASLLYAGPVDSLRAVIVNRHCRQVVTVLVCRPSIASHVVCLCEKPVLLLMNLSLSFGRVSVYCIDVTCFSPALVLSLSYWTPVRSLLTSCWCFLLFLPLTTPHPPRLYSLFCGMCYPLPNPHRTCYLYYTCEC